MLKLLQITDCHLLPPGGRIFDSDPAQRLAAAIADINRQHADAALCVLTGDIAHDGDGPAYELLRDLLAGLAVPWQLVPGNHDDKAAMRQVFPALTVDAEGFVQSVRDSPAGRLLFLDTVQAGTHSGIYCPARLRWLDRALSEGARQPAYIFMHHPPMTIAMPRLDQYRLVDHQPLGELLDRHGTVRHIFFGHVHRPVSGSWRGIPFSAVPGTNHQNRLDFTAGRENISTLEPPAYAVIFLDAETTVVHLHGFMDDSPQFLYDPAAAPEAQIRRL
ncbi:MAG: phosphodiesterase [Sneathiellaceae bacterium]